MLTFADNTLIPAQSGDQKQLGNVPAGALPYTLWQIIRASQKPCLIIAEDSQQAHSLEVSLSFLAKADQGLPISTLPDWETLPYDVFSPHDDIISSRLKALVELPMLKEGALIVSAATLMQRLAPQAFIGANTLILKLGQQLDTEDYRLALAKVGYRHVDTVYEHGEYAIRGAIFDVFPMGSEQPIRIELFDDEIDSLRFFDPETQRSLAKTESVDILPGNEFPWDQQSRLAFRNRWLEAFPEADASLPLLRDIKDGIKPHGLEYYAPLFFDGMATLFDYLPDGTLVLACGALDQHLQAFYREVQERYEDRRWDRLRPILPPEQLYLGVEEVFTDIKHLPRLNISASTVTQSVGRTNAGLSSLPPCAVDDRHEDPLRITRSVIQQFDGKTLLVAESAGRREMLAELFNKEQNKPHTCKDWQAFEASEAKLNLCVGGLAQGFRDDQAKIQVITETELYNQRVQQTRRRKTSSNQNNENAVKNLTELQIGSPVVHIDHGVGRYRGLELIEVDGQSNEFLTLEYANGAKLYVPVASLHLISRYSGTDEALAPLHRLGTEKWTAAKQKALEKVRDTAAELLEVYARREAEQGFAYQAPGQAYRAFCANFPFEETEDQEKAINAVLQDLMRPQPMDRLVCGDVGFGKTEVAMRAAFIASFNSKQVAVLVPTTLLAQQHYESFVDRFADTAVKVEVLSRFKSGKEQQKVIDDIAAGKVDIVIGTHKLIQGDLAFKDLGLLIIDEEHRFGVQQKEKLKAFRAQVDILTLTATPIPRTLNMAMGGIRDLSIIATPPAKRLSVRTFVREREDALIRESVLREVLRGGQVYYLFNDVKNIEKEVAHLQKLVPEARVGFAHGQMRERELEQAMSDFYHMRFNILVCSTIIETGIDIPNANTIIIDRADKFGLAQLHQLRGRVGRSHHQAYAYLLTPPAKNLSKDAEKRLEAISASQDLGAGFMLATHDLEIRGAGELLGEEQSGQIQNVGYSLYMELLEKAVESLKSGRALDLERDVHGSEVNLQLSAVIPEDYLPDVHNRLILYKRIANAKTKDDLKQLQIEMIDRFGLLPEPCKYLFRQTELKLRIAQMGILKLDAGRQFGKIEFAPDTQVDPLSIVQLVQAAPQMFKLEGASTLKFSTGVETEDALFNLIDEVLERFALKDAS